MKYNYGGNTRLFLVIDHNDILEKQYLRLVTLARACSFEGHIKFMRSPNRRTPISSLMTAQKRRCKLSLCWRGTKIIRISLVLPRVTNTTVVFHGFVVVFLAHFFGLKKIG